MSHLHKFNKKQKKAICPDNPTSGYVLKRIKSGSWTDISTLMFNAALFTIVKMWKQLKHPLMDERINNNVAFTYCEILFSHQKKKEGLL